MELTYLEEFLVVAKTAHLGRSSEILYTTPSSLSKHMRILEEFYGVAFFTRENRSILLNENGKMFLPYAEEIVRLNKTVSEKLKQTNENARISIATSYRIFEPAMEFQRKYSVGINLIENDSGRDLLKKGECELAFLIDADAQDSSLVRYPYKKDHLVMLCNRSHPLAKLERIPVTMLQNEDFVLFPEQDNSVISKNIRDLCHEAGFTPRIVFTATVGSNIVELVAKDVGISLLWSDALQSIVREEIAVVEIEPTKEVEISLCYQKRRRLSQYARLFVEYTKSLSEEKNVSE
ncbi:MAG: LysR family transcriptional regulator [Faecousia sp.]